MNRFGLTFILFSCITICCAQAQQRDTLWTVDKDRIIVTYDLHYDDDEVEISFIDVKKKLGHINCKKYNKLEETEVIFFDKTGVYEDMVFSNMTPKAFMVPSNLKYSKSDLGYFSLQDRPTLSFQIKENVAERISIPIYLAHYEGKGKRKLFSVSEEFNIELKSSIRNKVVTATKKAISVPVISTIEIEGDNEEAIEVSTQVKTVMTLLEVQTKLPFNEGLQYEINYLRGLQKKVTDRQLLSKIKECLTLCELKKIELEEKEVAEQKEAVRMAEKQARLEQEQAIARQDSIAQVQQKQAEGEKKRNIWMIIGGAILTAVCFIGNQLFQHFRSIRNHKNMMELQQDIARRAEYEAKRHAQNYARKKTNEMVNNVRRGTQEMAKNKIKQSKSNKSKNFSI